MIIGLGYKARTGKDTIAEHLVTKHSFIKESFAFPIKENVCRDICGFNDEQLYGSLKEVTDIEWSVTPRHMFHMVGDALRNINKDFYVLPMKRKLLKHILNNKNVVISDVRFFNEVDLIRSFNGFLVNVDRYDRKEITGISNHQSEIELDNYKNWDSFLINDSDIVTLYNKVDDLYNEFLEIMRKDVRK